MKKSAGSFIKLNRKAILLLGVVVSCGVFGLLASHSWATSSTFAPEVEYPTGQAPFSVAVADFNGDGKRDLAVANQASNTVSILLGTGTGTFAPKVDYPTGTGPFSVAVGDFNGDGKLDLAVANQTSNTVSILLGTGTGTFAAKADYPTGANSVFVSVGDFNSDGNPDIAVANYDSNTVSVLLGTNIGTFGPKVDYPTGLTPLSVTVGDFNGDGKPDLVVTTHESLSVLLGTGLGTFSPSLDYAFPGGFDIEYLAVRDLNGDGKLDLAVATGQTVAVLLGTGSGTFTGEVDYPTGGATGVVIGDFDGDGRPDLAIGSRSDPFISVLPGNGDGTFGAFVLYRVSFNPRSMAVGDFNGDGRTDLVSTAQFTNTVSVLINTTSAPSPTPTPIPTPTPTPAPQFALTVLKSGTGTGTVSSLPAGINCGAACVANYNVGTVVTLTATPSGGSQFGGWNSGCSGFGTCTVTMNAAQTVKAAFLAPTPTPTPQPQADLAVTNIHSGSTAIPGTTVSYTIVASNNGPAAVSGATVGDAFPAAVTAVSWTCIGTSGGSCPASGTGDINALVNLPVGGNATFTAQVTISPTATGSVLTTATVGSPAGTFDPNTANNTSQDTASLSPQSDLVITINDGVTVLSPGGTTVYTITGVNNGPSSSPTATVFDSFPTSLTGVSWTCTGTSGGICPATGTGNINAQVNLPAGGKVTFTALANVSAIAAGTISNITQLNGPNFDPVTGNNAATDADTIFQTYTIAGLIRDNAGNPIVNVTVDLSGSASATAITDSTGNYQFRSLVQGGNFTVTPRKSGVSFQPVNRVINNLNSNQLAASFTATLLTYSISGRIVDATSGVGVSGMTMTVHIAALQTAQVVTDNSGHYTISHVNPGDYTLHPSGGTRTFSPSARTATVQNQDVSVPDFTSAQPVASSKVAFDDWPNGIYVMDSDGGNMIRVTTGLDQVPNWSKDGSRIAFMRNGDIYVVNYDGSGLTRVTRDGGANPIWSPDSTKILYSHGDQNGATSIRVINANGTNIVTVCSNCNGATDWSPDGTKILYGVYHTGWPLEAAIYVMNADGTGRTRLSPPTQPWPNWVADSGAIWSPSGQNIAFEPSFHGDSGIYIYVMNANGSNRHLVARPSTVGYTNYTWSPDGRVAFQCGNGSSLCAVNADGTNATTLVTKPGKKLYGVVWGPKVVYSTQGGGFADDDSGLRSTQTSAGATTIVAGNLSLTFANVTAAGDTEINPISPTSLLPFPQGYSVLDGPGLAYDAHTAASYTSPVTSCVTVSSVDDPGVFSSLRLLQSENGVLVDRTLLAPDPLAPDFTTRKICSQTSSLTPLTVAQKQDINFAVLSGLLVDENGDPLPDQTVELTGDLQSSVLTDTNGQYRFVNVPPGGTYTVTPISSGQYSYSPQNRSYAGLSADKADPFAASTCSFGLSSANASFGRAGGDGQIVLNTTGGCGWSAFTSDRWISITSSPGGNGGAAISYNIAENMGDTRYGSITIAGNTLTIAQDVAGRAVSGRVVTPAGTGLRNATVVLTDTQGNRRTATTSSFGFYSFDNVPPGFSDRISVSSRLFRFAAQTIDVTSDLTDIDFVGLE